MRRPFIPKMQGACRTFQNRMSPVLNHRITAFLSGPSLDRDALLCLERIAIINVDAAVINELLPPALFVDTVNRKLVAPSPVSSAWSGALKVS